MNLALHGLLLQVIVSIVEIQNVFRLCSAGDPGYLDFDNLPETNFSCQGKVIGGYYADVEAGCQMFHVCTIGQKDEIMDIKFLCLNGTVFDQETRVCERVDEVDCSKSERFYNLNLELYGNNAVTLSLQESTNAEVDSTTSRHDHRHYYSSTRPSIVTTTTATTSSSTTPRPTQIGSTASNDGFRHPSGFRHQYYEQNYSPTVQPSLYNDKHDDYQHQFVFHNNDRKNKNSQATSYQLFSNNQGASSTTQSPRQTHQIRYSQSTAPQIIHSETYTIAPIIHATSTIQSLLKGKSDAQTLINPIYHNHGLSTSTTEQFTSHNNNPRETSEYDNTAEDDGNDEDDHDNGDDDDGDDDQSINEEESQINQDQNHGRRNMERQPLEAIQSTSQGKVSKLSISPIPQEESAMRTVINNNGLTSQRITINYLSTPRSSSQTTGGPTTYPSLNSQKHFKVTQHIILSPAHQSQRLNTHQITLNVPSQDIQRIVHSSPPLLPSQSRVIVTAKASVSDESGRPLNASQIITLPTIPSSYDDYKEGDESFDPFYRDVPKLSNQPNATPKKNHEEDAKRTNRRRRDVAETGRETTANYTAETDLGVEQQTQVPLSNVTEESKTKENDHPDDTTTLKPITNDTLRAILFGLPLNFRTNESTSNSDVASNNNTSQQYKEDDKEETIVNDEKIITYDENNTASNSLLKKKDFDELIELNGTSLDKMSDMKSVDNTKRVETDVDLTNAHRSSELLEPLPTSRLKQPNFRRRKEFHNREHIGPRQQRNRDRNVKSSRRSHKIYQHADDYSDYESDEIRERKKHGHRPYDDDGDDPINFYRHPKSRKNRPPEYDYDDETSYVSEDDYEIPNARSKQFYKDRNRRVSRKRKPIRYISDYEDYEDESIYKNRGLNYRRTKLNFKEGASRREFIVHDDKSESIGTEQSSFDKKLINEPVKRKSSNKESIYSDYDEDASLIAPKKESQSEQYEEYRSIYDDEYDYTDENFSDDEKNSAKHIDFSELDDKSKNESDSIKTLDVKVEQTTEDNHFIKFLDDKVELNDKIEQAENSENTTESVPLDDHNPSTPSTSLDADKNVTNANENDESDLIMTTLYPSDYVNDNYEPEVYKDVSNDTLTSTELAPHENTTSYDTNQHTIQTDKPETTNLNDTSTSYAETTTAESPATSPKPTTNLYKPISIRKNYNYIPPTTTPNPVIIKPRLPLVNPNPVKPMRTYNDVAPRPVIKRRPLLGRRNMATGNSPQITKQTTNETENNNIRSLELNHNNNSNFINFSTSDVPITRNNVNLFTNSTTHQDITTEKVNLTSTSTERAEINEHTEQDDATTAHSNEDRDPLRSNDHNDTTSESTTAMQEIETTTVTEIIQTTTTLTPTTVNVLQSTTSESQESSIEMDSIGQIQETNSKQANKTPGFNCLDKQLYRFYSDYRDCRLFHYCSPGFTARQVLDFRFVCEGGTVFDENTQTCRSQDPNINCSRRN